MFYLLKNKRMLYFSMLLVIVCGFGLRLSYAHSIGFGSDLHLLVQWARLVAREGLVEVYLQMPSAYPPLGTLLLYPSGLMCPSCAVDADPTLPELYVLRWLCTAFDLIIVAVLAWWGRRHGSPGRGLLAAAAYALFPVMPLVSGWWGQSDAWYLLTMLLAGMCLTEERPVLAWLCLALSALIKLQAIILLPVFIAGTWRWFGFKTLLRGSAVALLCVVIACLPLLLGGDMGEFIAAITLPIRQDPVMNRSHITLGGHNLWAGIALRQGLDIWGSYVHTITPGLTFYVAGMALLPLCLTMLGLRLFWRSTPQAAFAALGLAWIIFFQAAIGVGFRYLVPGVVYLLAAAITAPAWSWPALGLAIGTFFNFQYTIARAAYPLPWIELPGGMMTNIIFMLLCSGVAGDMFLRSSAFYAARRAQHTANRLERALAIAGTALVLLIIGGWVGYNVHLQRMHERQGHKLVADLRAALSDTSDALVVNWPKEVMARSDGWGAMPTGYVAPSLEEMGMAHAEAVIYSPWAATCEQAQGWDVDYHGVYVTEPELSARVREVERVIALNEAAHVVVLAERGATDRRPVATFAAGVDLLRADATYRAPALTVDLTWHSTAPLSETITTFVHVLGPDGELVAQNDGDPVNNLIPLGAWRESPEGALRETRTLLLSADFASGDYVIALGLYDRATSERIPVSCERCRDHSYHFRPAPSPAK